jgi:pimeloyl-ACP methyl ester carboxylesterase
MARVFAKTLEQQLTTVTSDKIHDGRQRAAAFLAQPAQQHVSELVTPMLQAEFLINYGRRMLADAAHPIEDALAGVDAPVMLVTGDCDSVVNNDHTRIGLKTWGPAAIHATIKGGGHYLQDLQYPYFRLTLAEFLAGRIPPSSARIQVKRLE